MRGSSSIRQISMVAGSTAAATRGDRPSPTRSASKASQPIIQMALGSTPRAPASISALSGVA